MDFSAEGYQETIQPMQASASMASLPERLSISLTAIMTSQKYLEDQDPMYKGRESESISNRHICKSQVMQSAEIFSNSRRMLFNVHRGTMFNSQDCGRKDTRLGKMYARDPSGCPRKTKKAERN